MKDNQEMLNEFKENRWDIQEMISDLNQFDQSLEYVKQK